MLILLCIYSFAHRKHQPNTVIVAANVAKCKTKHESFTFQNISPAMERKYGDTFRQIPQLWRISANARGV